MSRDGFMVASRTESRHCHPLPCKCVCLCVCGMRVICVRV